MIKREIESLRDLAVAHLPKAREQRALAIRLYGAGFADSALQSAYLFGNPEATAIEKQAIELLQLTFIHPDARPIQPYPLDAEQIAAEERSMAEWNGILPQLETAILDNAILLCRLTGDALPPWVDTADAPAAKMEAVRLPVATQQNTAILSWLKVSRHDPLKLPVPPSGKAGVKKLCRDALCESSKQLFSSASVFNTVWERLRANNEIKDASDTNHPTTHP